MKKQRWVNIDDGVWKERIAEVIAKGYSFCFDDNGKMISRVASIEPRIMSYMMEKEVDEQEVEIAPQSDAERQDEVRNLRMKVLGQYETTGPTACDYPYDRYGFFHRIWNRIRNIDLRIIKFDAFGYRVRLRVRETKPRILFNVYKPKNWLNGVNTRGLDE